MSMNESWALCGSTSVPVPVRSGQMNDLELILWKCSYWEDPSHSQDTLEELFSLRNV